MSRMDNGTTHRLRHEFARATERDLQDAYSDAKSSGDHDRASLIEEEFARRGISI